MIIKQKFSIDFQYDILFTRNIFSPENNHLARILGDGAKLVLVIDEGILQANDTLLPEIDLYFRRLPAIKLLAPPLIVTGGEETKNSTKELIRVLELIDQAKVDRHAYVIGIGGGSVLDMVGFAAAIAHRGIRHIRIPTTTPSQNDSGVGVKNGINYFGKKNFLGAFVPPVAVINDYRFLESLGDRDWRSGTSEAVKVALIKDRNFFYWIKEHARRLDARDMTAMEHLVFRCAELHSDHIAHSDDPFEMGSSRPLDFGHWAAHKLEQLSDYDLRHGEAVAIGIALDVCYAVEAGFLEAGIADEILEVLLDLGFDLSHPSLYAADGISINAELIRGLEEFREHLGGQLTIPMIREIGSKFDVHTMNPLLIEKAVKALTRKKASYAN